MENRNKPHDARERAWSRQIASDSGFETGSQSNYFTLTFDGVDMMGERLSEEVAP